MNDPFVMPKKRRTEAGPKDIRLHRDGRRSGNKRESSADAEDPALILKRKEIEDALDQQRQRRSAAAGLDQCTASICNDHSRVEPYRQMPGYYYDTTKNRYFKINKSKMSATVRMALPKQILQPHPRTATLETGLLSVLQQRLAGSQIRPMVVMNQLLGRVRSEYLDDYSVSPTDSMSAHSVFGLAISSGPKALQVISKANLQIFQLGSQGHSTVLALAWNPSNTVPIIATIKHTDCVDRVEVYKLDFDGVGQLCVPQVISGVLPSRHQKEIFQSIEWAVNGRACYSGGDVGLWKHDLEGRHGRHLVLDGISTVNSIEPHLNSCVTMGLRNGRVVEVDERERDRKGRLVASLARAIDHVKTLKDGNYCVCQDITNNMMLYDKRNPGVAVHSLRGAVYPATTPRGFSYYEGEAAVRNRHFWVSPRFEYIVVSSGIRGEEKLVIMDPRKPVDHTTSLGDTEQSNVLHTIIPRRLRNHGLGGFNASGYWKLARGSYFENDWDEFSGCYGMHVDNCEDLMSAACINLLEQVI